jgi:hypothetical protein
MSIAEAEIGFHLIFALSIKEISYSPRLRISASGFIRIDVDQVLVNVKQK